MLLAQVTKAATGAEAQLGVCDALLLLGFALLIAFGVWLDLAKKKRSSRDISLTGEPFIDSGVTAPIPNFEGAEVAATPVSQAEARMDDTTEQLPGFWYSREQVPHSELGRLEGE